MRKNYSIKSKGDGDNKTLNIKGDGNFTIDAVSRLYQDVKKKLKPGYSIEVEWNGMDNIDVVGLQFMHSLKLFCLKNNGIFKTAINYNDTQKELLVRTGMEKIVNTNNNL